MRMLRAKVFSGVAEAGWGTSLAEAKPTDRNRAGGGTRIKTPNPRARRLRAFTLIELLVVIAIIAALASMVIGGAGIASRKIKESRVRAELSNLVSAIENYKSERRLGSYPPDNPNNPQLPPLFYELSGAVFKDMQFITYGSSEAISVSTLQNVFGVSGVQNSSREAADIPFRNFAPKPTQYAELVGNEDVEVLIVPYPGPRMVQGKTGMINPWFYDASSTNRHNRQSYDLWAEVTIGKQTKIIGNWKE